MNIHHAINIFEKHYGKKRKATKISIDGCHIYAKAIYDKDETVMFKIWIKRDAPDYVHTTENSFELVLWHDNIYTNEYFMPDSEKQNHFFKTLKKMNTCLADFMFNNISIELDNHQIEELYHKNRSEMLRDMEYISKYDAYQDDEKQDNYWYDRSIQSIVEQAYFEQYLTKLIKERNLKAA